MNENKLIWQGSLSQLKAFVGTQVNQASANKATWRSPSGGTWCYKGDNDLSDTWYSKSKTIAFDGKAADEIKKRIHEAINSRHNTSLPSVLNTNDQNLSITEEDKRGFGDCYKLSIEMAEVKLELAMLSALVDRSELNKNFINPPCSLFYLTVKSAKISLHLSFKRFIKYNATFSRALFQNSETSPKVQYIKPLNGKTY